MKIYKGKYVDAQIDIYVPMGSAKKTLFYPQKSIFGQNRVNFGPKSPESILFRISGKFYS